MATTRGSLPLNGPYPQPTGPHLHLVQPEPDNTGVSFEDGVMKIEHPDGSVTINFDGKSADKKKDDSHDANLAEQMEQSELDGIASELLEGVKRDLDSRREWFETRARGIELLGLKLEKPRSDAGVSGAPLEGMSTVRHPLLLEATVSFQATARAELLPASGPVKVRNDMPPPPLGVAQQDHEQREETQPHTPTWAQKELTDSLETTDELGNALEKDMNHYLTVVATEYIPDTDRMLFYVGFGGDGFKKVYNCPLRQRPVSESVDAEDLIVSNAVTDLQSSPRVTHRIKMRKSVLRRMQIIGAYLDVDLTPPLAQETTPVDKQKEAVAGVNTAYQTPEDRDYEVYEIYCELDLDDFAPKQFKGKGLPLPFRVTIEKDSRKVLDIRRNWKKDDGQASARRFFVQYPFIRGLGFYGLGFVHLLGNTTNALTAAWRINIDAGMFASFPGFLYAKQLGRQNTNQFRVPPGGGLGLDLGAQQSIKDAVMPLPYKEVGPSFNNFITQVQDRGDRLAATGNVKVGEGKQDVPVGTTLALIEQASKVMDSAHKRLHSAQAEEFQLLVERFREDPEAFWRNSKGMTHQWEKDQFLKALDDYNLVPVADPNNPTSLHRAAKALGIKQLQAATPDIYDPVAVDMRVMRILDIDPSGLFRSEPAPPPPDPRMAAVQAKAQAEQQKNQIAQLETQIKAATAQQQFADKAQERASRERIENMKIQLQRLKLQQEQVIHAHDAARDAALAQHQAHLDAVGRMSEVHADSVARAHDLAADNAERQHELRGGIIKSAQEIAMEQQRHEADMRRSDELHRMKMEHEKEMHAARLEAAKQLARAKPKAKKNEGN